MYLPHLASFLQFCPDMTGWPILLAAKLEISLLLLHQPHHHLPPLPREIPKSQIAFHQGDHCWPDIEYLGWRQQILILKCENMKQHCFLQSLDSQTLMIVFVKLFKIVHNFTDGVQTSQELRMLSSVTIDCQITKIVMDSGSQLSELWSVSQRSQVSGIAPWGCSVKEAGR